MLIPEAFLVSGSCKKADAQHVCCNMFARKVTHCAALRLRGKTVILMAGSQSSLRCIKLSNSTTSRETASRQSSPTVLSLEVLE